MSEYGPVDGIYPFPASLHSQKIEVNGASIHVRMGGSGPAVLCCTALAPRVTCGDIWRAR